MKRRIVVPFVLLLVVFVVGHWAPHKRWTHANEVNNLTGAWLVSDGWVAYRDFFTHHAPFAYWFAAPMVRIFGANIATCRWTLLAFYAMALAVLYWANRRSSRPFSFGLFVLFVALGHVLYMGHLYLYDGVFAFAILLIFHQFWRFDEQHAMQWRDWVVVALAVFVAISATVTAAYALALLTVGLAVKHFRFERRKYPVLRAVGVCGIVAVPLAGAAVYLWATGSLRDFYEQLYLFNVRYYRLHAGYETWAPSLSPLAFLFASAGRGMGFLFEAVLFRHGAIECVLAWCNVGVVVTLAATGRWLTALFYAAYICTLMLRMYASYQAPYIVQSLWAAAWLLQPIGERASAAWRSLREGTPAVPASFADLLRSAAAILLIVLLAQAYIADSALERRSEMPDEEVAQLCARLTSPGERIAVLPDAAAIYVGSGRKPAIPSFSYYPFVDRWEQLRRQMVESIENQKAKVMVINWWLPAGSVNMRTFASEVRDAIRRNYQPLSIAIPTVYARNASYYELLGRYERVRHGPVLEVPERNLLAVPVFGTTPVTQYFTASSRVTSAKLEVLLSATRRASAWADIVFGVVEDDGHERVLVRDRVRAPEVRYVPTLSSKTDWHALRLTSAGDLEPRRRYFLRVSSIVSSEPDVFQVWTAPAEKKAGIGETIYGGEPLGRTVCFRLSGIASREARSRYPIVEQSLARASVPSGSAGTPTAAGAARISQSLTMPEATTISAVSLLLGGSATGAGGTPYLLKILAESEETLASQTFSPPRTEREWQTISFSPIFLEKEQRLTLAVSSEHPSTASFLRVWTAGCDLYSGGGLAVAGVEREDDLCFKLYELAPEQAALPDIAVSALDFKPAEPMSVAPKGPLCFTVRVENRGTSPTGPFWVEFLASPKDLAGPIRFAADSVNIGNIEPGDVWEQTLERTLYPLDDGLYALRAVADRIGEVYEGNEENNSAEAGNKNLLVLGRAAQANLVVDMFKIGSVKLRRGRAIEIAGRVSNRGEAAAGRFVIEFWAARDPADTARHFAICDPIVVESLAPNAILDLSEYPRTLRAEMPVGQLHIGCSVDARDEVVETEERANTAVFGPVTVEP